ncbi:helix-turn-helix domain-containing protein [Paenibacillus sedimenti]|uniref:AraC family transcriptional regulator n=1 Tax=Paenibacillus sedimenti TaxID=2770274 RepID=A0A926KTS3_9BACL|nr:helix-turn-helix domain-containing protein [Paenibacillus sedimenti]MBD0384047.1 AraC family transcriptional regulator [Paenibacillus sedimenti]
MHRYLLRLLAFSFLLGVLPVIVIGIFSSSVATRDLEDKVKEGNMQWLTQTQMRVEQMLRSIEKSATQFANSSQVQTAMNASYDINHFEQIRDLSVSLYNLQSSDVVITQAYLVNFEHNWSLDLNTMKPLDQSGYSKAFRDYALLPKSIFWTTESASANDGEDANPAEMITLVHKIPILPQTSKPQGLVVVRISASDIRDALAADNSPSRNYILDRSGADILATAKMREGYREVNLAIAKRLAELPDIRQGLFNTRLNKEEVAVLYRSSGYNGWTYVSVISIDEITRETRKIAELTLIVCASILLVVLVFALYGSRRMYRPIQHLLDVAKGIHPKLNVQPIRPRTDELEFIKVSFQSLAVSRNQMEQQMLGQAGHLKEFFVLKLLTGQLTDTDYLLRSAMYGFPEGWKRLGVLTLQIDNLQETKYQEQDRELLLYAINNIAQEILLHESRFTPILLNRSQVTIVATDKEEPAEVKSALYLAAESIKTNAEQYLQIKVSIGISKPYHSLADTVKAYGESLAALKSRISLGPDIIVHYEDVENNPGVDKYVYTHLKVMEEQLVYTLREMQLDKAAELFQQYLNALLHKDGYLYEHHILLLQLISRILQIVQEHGISIKKVLTDEGAVERLLRLQTREEIQHWFETKLFVPTIEVLSEKSESQYVKIADKLVRMIQEQYDQEITLEFCAEALNYHPVYLSRIFKKEIGTTFSDYLSDYRMKMAKVMLETTDMKVSEIGEKLQYKNISAFIRSFRKIYDITPGQYREKLDQKQI